jgi:hypothetical protein
MDTRDDRDPEDVDELEEETGVTKEQWQVILLMLAFGGLGMGDFDDLGDW